MLFIFKYFSYHCNKRHRSLLCKCNVLLSHCTSHNFYILHKTLFQFHQPPTTPCFFHNYANNHQSTYKLDCSKCIFLSGLHPFHKQHYKESSQPIAQVYINYLDHSLSLCKNIKKVRNKDEVHHLLLLGISFCGYNRNYELSKSLLEN